MATIYLKHPVSKEDKAKYNSKGDKIIDIRFAPEVEKPKPKAAPKTKD